MKTELIEWVPIPKNRYADNPYLLKYGRGWRAHKHSQSVTFLAGRGKICHTHGVIHMATRRPARNTPIHMDLGPFQRKPYKKSMCIGVLWAGLCCHVDHPCAWQISPRPLLEKSLIQSSGFRQSTPLIEGGGNLHPLD